MPLQLTLTLHKMTLVQDGPMPQTYITLHKAHINLWSVRYRVAQSFTTYIKQDSHARGYSRVQRFLSGNFKGQSQRQGRNHIDTLLWDFGLQNCKRKKSWCSLLPGLEPIHYCSYRTGTLCMTAKALWITFATKHQGVLFLSYTKISLIISFA